MRSFKALIFAVLAVNFVLAQDDQSRAWGAKMCFNEPSKTPSLPHFPAGTRVRVNCPEGYAYVALQSGDNDDREVTCTSSGTWNKQLGSCQRIGGICNKPTIPQRGFIESQSAPTDESPDKFAEGSEINFGCNAGYTPDGTATLICQSNSRWSPRNPPRCVRDNYPSPPSPSNQQCYMPSIPTNGDIRLQSPTDFTGLFFDQGSFITYRCNTGFEMDPGTETINCMSNGQWDGFPPQCYSTATGTGGNNNNARTCVRPQTPAGARITRSSELNTPNRYPVGGYITYSCILGFRRTSTIVCLSGGSWSKSPPIRC